MAEKQQKTKDTKEHFFVLPDDRFVDFSIYVIGLVGNPDMSGKEYILESTCLKQSVPGEK